MAFVFSEGDKPFLGEGNKFQGPEINAERRFRGRGNEYKRVPMKPHSKRGKMVQAKTLLFGLIQSCDVDNGSRPGECRCTFEPIRNEFSGFLGIHAELIKLVCLHNYWITFEHSINAALNLNDKTIESFYMPAHTS